MSKLTALEKFYLTINYLNPPRKNTQQETHPLLSSQNPVKLTKISRLEENSDLENCYNLIRPRYITCSQNERWSSFGSDSSEKGGKNENFRSNSSIGSLDTKCYETDSRTCNSSCSNERTLSQNLSEFSQCSPEPIGDLPDVNLSDLTSKLVDPSSVNESDTTAQRSLTVKSSNRNDTLVCSTDAESIVSSRKKNMEADLILLKNGEENHHAKAKESQFPVVKQAKLVKITPWKLCCFDELPGIHRLSGRKNQIKRPAPEIPMKKITPLAVSNKRIFRVFLKFFILINFRFLLSQSKILRQNFDRKVEIELQNRSSDLFTNFTTLSNFYGKSNSEANFCENLEYQVS